MRESRNADIGIIQALVNNIQKKPEEEKGLYEKTILLMWKFIKSKTKYKPKHNDPWLEVEKEYIKEMAGKKNLKQLKEKFKHRSEGALIEQLRRMKLLEKFK